MALSASQAFAFGPVKACETTTADYVSPGELQMRAYAEKAIEPILSRLERGVAPKDLVPEYLAVRQFLPIERQIDIDGRFLLHGVDPTPRDPNRRLSEKVPNEDVALATALKYGANLTLGNRILGFMASLKQLAREFLTGDLDMKTLKNDERVWPTHAEEHAYNIAAYGVEAVELAWKTGMLQKVLSSDPRTAEAEKQQLKVLAALLGLTHDMGMFRSGGGIRENHWKIVGNFAYGGNYKGTDVPLQRQRQLLDKFVHDFARDKENPLRQAFLELVRDPAFAERYGKKGATEEEKIEVLVREFLVANYSHGVKSVKSLSKKELATRRKAYLEELGLAPTEEFEPAKVGSYYRDGDTEHFMAWADPKYADNPAAAKLQRLFSLGEHFLNYADANRARGPGRLYGPGGVQIIRHVGADGKVTAYAVLVGPKGEKALVDIGERIFAGTNVFPMETVPEPRGSKAPVRYQYRVVHASFAESTAAVAGIQTGRLVGRDSVFFHRGLGDMISLDALPKVEVRVPAKEGDHPTFESSLAQSISFNMAQTLFRNGWLKEKPPEKVAEILKTAREMPDPKTWPDGMAEYLTQFGKDHWYFTFDGKPNGPEKPESSAVIEGQRRAKFDKPDAKVGGKPARLADREDVDRKEAVARLVAAGAFPDPHTVIDPGTGKEAEYRPELLLKGAFFAEIEDGKNLVELGAPRGMVYLVVKGKVKGAGFLGTGNRTFTAEGTDKLWPILGGTAFLTKSDPGRNATLSADGPVTVLCIPKETAETYWNPRYLAIPKGKEKEHFQRMYPDG